MPKVYKLEINKTFYSLFSKLKFKTQLYSQFYNIEGKKIDSNDFNGTYGRIFPMTGLYFTTPLVNRKYNFHVTSQDSQFWAPKIFEDIKK